jgi:hypothetical protein
VRAVMTVVSSALSQDASRHDHKYKNDHRNKSTNRYDHADEDIVICDCSLERSPSSGTLDGAVMYVCSTRSVRV